MSVPVKKDDPAYWLLEEGLSGKREVKKAEVYNEDCYICNDPEFALMGLPLCYPCYLCGAHVPADDCICDNGHDQTEDPRIDAQEEEQSKEKEEKPVDVLDQVIEEKQQELKDLMKLRGDTNG